MTLGNNAAGVPIDRHALHEHLWRKRNRLGKVTVNQRELAAHLGIAERTMSVVMHELIDAGRVRRVGSRQRYVGEFVVADPAEWVQHATGA